MSGTNVETVMMDALAEILEREGDIAEHRAAQKELFNAVKAMGIDIKAFRTLVSRAKRDRDEVIEADEQLAMYEKALKMKMPDW